MRPPQRRLLRRTWRWRASLWLASSAVVVAACLAAADDAPNSSTSTAAMHAPAAEGPSTFDFMVFASMADSPHLLAMAGYRPVPRQCAALPSTAATVARPAAGGKLPQCRL